LTVTDLGDGIWRITAPLPFAAPKSVNCYVFEGHDGLTMLDCGVESEEGLGAIRTGLATIGGSLTTLIGSHLHVDHVAAAGTLVEETGARWVMHETTPDEIPRYNDWTLRATALAEAAGAHGAPTEFTQALHTDWERPHWYGVAMNPTDAVADDDRISLGGDR
jgi:glyoxylase-like metal-dependent hydrolase (beta-lactamase superfamily II)